MNYKVNLRLAAARYLFIGELANAPFPEQLATVREVLVAWLDLVEYSDYESTVLRVLEALPP